MSKISINSHSENLVASIVLPASKSISNRAAILKEVIKQISNKDVNLQNLSNAEDTSIILQALAEPKGSIDIKNAGTCLRFLTAYFAASVGTEVCLISSNERMKQRPIASLVSALKQLGADITYLEQEGTLPIAIKGKKLIGGTIPIEANESSQFASALLLVSPLMESPLRLEFANKVVSKNYILMTQIMMKQFGFSCKVAENFESVQTEKNEYKHALESYKIEADWSSAAFFYEAALLAEKADILFQNLSLQSIQGDAILAAWMEPLGIKSLQKEEGVYIYKSKPLLESKMELDFTHHPDLAPAFICALAAAGIACNAIGLNSLIFKESNRLKALENTLKKLHFKVETDEKSYLKHDGLQHAFYANETLHTESDHRLAMAYAMLSVHFANINLSEIDSVKKSFPNFFQEAAKIGVKALVKKP
ncbi:MAG: 3-phosphoshikimate 1-carboxyvinyltransferase [bacterium]|nr:3-phosphoshikimate 1-carboxyvinyltransferase [bacterium]